MPTVSLFACLVTVAFTMLASSPLRAEIQHVIAISIDGGRGDFIRDFIVNAPSEFPNFKRLRDQSGHTFNARCDYTESITIPDHLCMLTGRPVRQPVGLPATIQHGIISDAPAATETAHNSGLNSGVYKASIFDVVHDRGLSTALYMGKTRLTICDRSWDGTNGALDTIGANNGRDKIDFAHIVEASGNAAATPGLLAELVTVIQAGTLKNFTLWHVADTDYAGHSGGWNMTVNMPYRNAMKTADGWLGQILDAVDNNVTLAGKVAIMLTADHGGGGGSIATHVDATYPENYTIPFFLLAPGIAAGSNLHDWMENRFEPVGIRPTYTFSRQPMRNGDVANLAAALLGLPSVPGSLMKPEFKKPVNVAREGEAVTVSWPGYLTGWTLEFTDDLEHGPWQTISSGIIETGGQRVHTVSPPLPPARHFRLRSPAGP
jgi:hypothetical protein